MDESVQIQWNKEVQLVQWQVESAEKKLKEQQKMQPISQVELLKAEDAYNLQLEKLNTLKSTEALIGWLNKIILSEKSTGLELGRVAGQLKRSLEQLEEDLTKANDGINKVKITLKNRKKLYFDVITYSKNRLNEKEKSLALEIKNLKNQFGSAKSEQEEMHNLETALYGQLKMIQHARKQVYFNSDSEVEKMAGQLIRNTLSAYKPKVFAKIGVNDIFGRKIDK